MAFSIGAFSSVAGLAYEAAAGDGDWTPFVRGAWELLDVRSAALATAIADDRDGSPGGPVVIVPDHPCTMEPPQGPDPLVEEVWRKPRGVAAVFNGLGSSCLGVVGPAYFEQYLAGRLDHALIVLTEPVGGRTNFFSVGRAPGQDPFSPAEVQTFEALSGHVARAIELRSRVSAADVPAERLDRVSSAIFQLDRRAGIVHLNGKARELLDKGDGIAFRNGRLELGGVSNFDRTFERVAGTPLSQPEFFSLRQRGATRYLNCMLLHGDWAYPPVPGVAAQLLIFDPRGHSYPSARSLIHQYGLTEAEARMLLAFVRTQGIQEAAEDLGVSPETARSHLKSIFAKTGANSQAKLMHLVLKHPESVVGEVMSFER